MQAPLVSIEKAKPLIHAASLKRRKMEDAGLVTTLSHGSSAEIEMSIDYAGSRASNVEREATVGIDVDVRQLLLVNALPEKLVVVAVSAIRPKRRHFFIG